MILKNFTIREVHEGLLSHDFTCVELTTAYLQRIHDRNDLINAFITVTDELALSAAYDVDKKIARGETIGILEGVPCAIKDNILVAGVRATAGSKILNNYVATYSATVIEKLMRAGVVILGKTNMDEFAMGSSGETSAYGVTRNPLDETRVPGGSSSGSAAAVADNQCVFALGSDTGGSIRQPASLTGLVALKPTYGMVSRHGLIAMASSFDQIGPIAKNVHDNAVILECLAGVDPQDSTTVDYKASWFKNLSKPFDGVKIGLPSEYFIKGMDETVEAAVLRAVNKLRDLGAVVKEVSLPYTRYALSTYYILMSAEVSSNLARFDGVRYGARVEGSNVEDMYLKTRRQGFGDEVKRRVMLGTYVLSSGYNDEYYKKAQRVRTLLRKDFESAFSEVDFIITPTTPGMAFKLGEKFDDPMTMYLADIFTVSANVAGIPAISVPVGMNENLPIGMQIMGPTGSDAEILRLAHSYESFK